MKMTKKRKEALRRRPDGTFGPWKGGKTLSELKKKRNTFHGIAVHIGKEFKRQHGRKANVGGVVRTKTKSGQYHKGAFWYVRTPNGWRRSPTGTRKPNLTQIEALCQASRKGW